MTVTDRERAAMARARELGAAVLGSTSPNPAVGAVILAADGTVAGEGATQPPGGAHAEVRALAAAGERARGGTSVVTLEPCAHTGRTGPCADALIAAGVARVVVAVPEPTSLAGGGVERLRAAGIDVELGVEQAEAELGALGPLAHRGPRAPPAGRLEGRHHPRRPGGRRRRQQPLDHR